MSFKLKTWPAAALLATALLAACGGGGDQIEPFQPARVLAFGDEASVLDDVQGTDNPLATTRNGTRFGVNGLTTAGALDCTLNPIWIQHLASSYSLGFPQCNPANAATTSRILAAQGATVAGVTAQIDSFLSTDSFGGKDLVTVMAGTHDVLAQYNRVKVENVSEADATVAIEAAGTALAQQVNRIANAGGKVLISTIPNVGITPFAVTAEAAPNGAGSAALLSRLSARFNSRLRVGLLNDGRKIGLMLADENFDAIVKAGGGGFVNITVPACNASTVGNLRSCTSSTLVAEGSASNYLWAGTLQPSAGGHSVIGGLAISRARGNPF